MIEDKELDAIIEEKAQENNVVVSEKQPSTLPTSFDKQATDNSLITALANNQVAVDMARDSYASLKNQKKISKKIEDVVKANTESDIETAKIVVEEKDKNNKVKKAEIRNALLKLKNDKIYLEREQKHRLEMQRAAQIKQKYEDLLLRTCRKKQKDEHGKWVFMNDKDGNPIINIPGKFKLFWLKLFDGLISTLNQTADIFGALNKNVIKGSFIILAMLLLLVPPFRSWLLGLIGINLG